MFLELLEMQLEVKKEKLVDCGPGEFQSLQGEARALDAVRKAIANYKPLPSS